MRVESIFIIKIVEISLTDGTKTKSTTRMPRPTASGTPRNTQDLQTTDT